MKSIYRKTPSEFTLLFLSILLGSFNSTTIGQIQWDNGGTGSDWSTPENWVGDVLPGATDVAEIGNGNTGFPTATADYTTGATTVNGLSVGVNGSANGTLNVTGGTLTVNNTNGFNVGSNNSSNGTVNINGGTLEIQQANNFIGNSSTGSGVVNLNSGTLRNASGSWTNFWMGNGGGTAALNISGGNLNNIRMTLNSGGTGTTSISVAGDAASIDFENWTFAGTTNINLTAGSTGISLLDINFWSGDGTENLTIDISGYDTSNGTSLTLIDNQFATFDASRFDSIVLTGGTGDLNYTADGSGTILTLDNIVIVPEPSVYALFGGCLALGAALLRRNRRG